MSWPYNTITDGNAVTQTGIANALGIWDYLKNSGDHPEAKHMGLTWVGQVGGKREGRRFKGQYVQSQNDVYPNAVAGKHWKPSPADPDPPKPMLYWDRVAYSGWSFDLHNPKGMLDPDHPPFVPTMTPYMFSTPLRSLVSKDVSNLFFAGRLASFSHVVYGSQRVMRTCATMGQAVGTAAAYAVRHGLAPIELKDHPEAVWSIQQQLLRDDAFVIGVLNEDPRDYARNATVSATSEQAGPTVAAEASDRGPGGGRRRRQDQQQQQAAGLDGRAVNVISGQSRAVTGAKGVAPGQGLNGTNRWISTTLPATLTLQLAAPATLAQVQLVFDTGMHRKLNFNPVGARKDALHWSPQPETVRDYVIEGRATPSGEWVALCNVSGNYLRRRVHSLPCSTAPEPGPGPPPPPAPPAVAEGALIVDLCTGDLGQMWSMANGTGVVSTVLGGRKYCLGYSKNLSAFGGKGSAVVALPCDQKPDGGGQETSWSLKLPRNDTTPGAFLQVAEGAPCLARPGAACDAAKASSVTIAGAGDPGFNGKYTATEGTAEGGRKQDGAMPMFAMDATHQLYRYGSMWHLGEMGTSVAYTATSGGLAGPPVPSGWQTSAGIAPPPRSVTCQGAGLEPSQAHCSCVHAVACAACHSEEYFPKTSVELTDCAADVTHIRWRQLEISGDNSKGSAMLMSGGLCLGLPAPAAESVTVAGRAGAEPVWSGMAVRPSNDDRRAAPPGVLKPLSEIRVTVSATNGIDVAVINEVRLYDQLGAQPFPVQPK